MTRVISCFLLLALLIDCSMTDDAVIEDRVSAIEVFDTDNNNSTTDLIVLFEILNISSIEEFRLILLPVEGIGFSKHEALLLDESRYHSVLVSEGPQFVVQLDDMLDVNGANVVEGKNYTVKVLMIGNDFNQLSTINSNVIRLENKGVLDGYYEGVLKHNIGPGNRFLQNGQSITSPVRGVLAQNTNDERYLASLEIEMNGFNNSNDLGGSIWFELSDEKKLTDIEASGGVATYTNEYLNCEDSNAGILTGANSDKMIIEIFGTNCEDGFFELFLYRSIGPASN